MNNFIDEIHRPENLFKLNNLNLEEGEKRALKKRDAIKSRWTRGVIKRNHGWHRFISLISSCLPILPAFKDYTPTRRPLKNPGRASRHCKRVGRRDGRSGVQGFTEISRVILFDGNPLAASRKRSLG